VNAVCAAFVKILRTVLLLDCVLRSAANISADAYTVGSDCTVQWSKEENTANGGGKKRSVSTIAACQQECLNNASCNGFDWNPANWPTGQCWLSGPWSLGKHPFRGVTHYTLVTRCDGKYRM